MSILENWKSNPPLQLFNQHLGVPETGIDDIKNDVAESMTDQCLPHCLQAMDFKNEWKKISVSV